MIGICFTNTKPNMVPWGGSVTRIGNNPLIIAIPRKEGHVVMDMAISQYSFGKIQEYAMKKEKLPYPGGFDNKGNLTRDPATILHNEKSIPIGLWKGTALSMMLDLMASVLAGGDTTATISSREEEYGLSQVFIAIQPGVLPEQERDRLINEVLHYTRDVQGFSPGERTYYPGEKTLMVREQNRKQGIPINRVILEEINKL
jgi:3-dehydro-L-gulonate 2-dehydrogenase